MEFSTKYLLLFLKRAFLALFFCCFSLSLLHGESAQQLINQGERLYKKNTPYTLKKSYSLFEKAYKEAKKSGSYSKRYQSLNGLIRSGRKLKRNTTSFQNALRALQIPRYKNYSLSNTKLIIRFDRSLKKNHYRYFRINNKKIVIDIFSDFQAKTIRREKRFVKKIVVANYQEGLTRVVLETDTNIRFNISVWKNSLIISLKNKKTTSRKVIQSKKSKRKPPKKSYSNPKRGQKIVVIDPGHGGRDSGAIGYRKIKEKDVVLQIGKKLEKELRKKGFKTYMTRSKDVFIRLENRTRFANKKNAHLFVSIHANSIPVKKSVNGVETYFLSTARTARAKRVAAKENAVDLKTMESMSKKTFLNFLNREKIVSSNKLAIDLQKGILDSLRSKYSSVRDVGVKEGPFWVLVGAQMPAVLVETGFVSNKKEALRLKNSHYQDLLAKGLANGIERFFINNGRL